MILSTLGPSRPSFWSRHIRAGLYILVMGWGLLTAPQASAAGYAVAHAVNAIGEFTVFRTDGIQEQLEGRVSPVI